MYVIFTHRILCTSGPKHMDRYFTPQSQSWVLHKHIPSAVKKVSVGKKLPWHDICYGISCIPCTLKQRGWMWAEDKPLPPCSVILYCTVLTGGQSSLWHVTMITIKSNHWCSNLPVCSSVYMCVCVCVWERERLHITKLMCCSKYIRKMVK